MSFTVCTTGWKLTADWMKPGVRPVLSSIYSMKRIRQYGKMVAKHVLSYMLFISTDTLFKPESGKAHGRTDNFCHLRFRRIRNSCELWWGKDREDCSSKLWEYVEVLKIFFKLLPTFMKMSTEISNIIVMMSTYCKKRGHY